VSAVFASAGIAGFAVAMAAKGTLSNLFGGVTILVEQVRSNPLAAQDPEPRVRFRKFGDSSLDFELLCWAKRPHDRGKLMHRLNTDIYNAFAGAGIEIPFPQRDAHLKQE
jgi:MscS family membrane protein